MNIWVEDMNEHIRLKIRMRNEIEDMRLNI